MILPLYGFVEGDTLGLLVLAEEDDTMATLADKLQAAASVRVAPRARVKVVVDGRAVPPEVTVRVAGLRPLQRIDLVEDASDAEDAE